MEVTLSSIHAACDASVLTLCAQSPAEEIEGRARPIKEVSVSSPVFQEVINAFAVEEGDTVKEGQVLVQLRCEKEQLEFERTQKLIELAEFKYKGANSLFKDKMGSQEKALEEKAQLELAQIMHRAAEVSLKEKTVRAPLSGIVVKKHKEAGESVDRVEKLVDIINIDRVFVQFYLDPKLMPSLQIEDPVKVKFPAIGPQAFQAKVVFIDPSIDAGSGLFRVKVRIENLDHQIKANMRGVADFGTVPSR